MPAYEIFLWVFSLILSATSLIFAFLASYFSNSTSKQMKEFIEKTWIVQEARGIFMTQLKQIEKENSRAIEVLKYNSFWNKYFYAIINARLQPITNTSKQFLKNTVYSELVQQYENAKRSLDAKFRDLVDFQNLNDNNVKRIDPIKVRELIKYHMVVKGEIKKIIAEFTRIVDQ